MKQEERISDNRQARLRRMRLLLMAIHPDADMIDIELELAIELQERPL